MKLPTTAVRRIVPLPTGPHQDGAPPPERVWYASYGSNLNLARLRCYLRGGRPPGGTRVHPGSRDRRPPRCSAPVELPGALYFATRSAVWDGGRAFYDPEAAGRVLARAYEITAEQFSDIAAQEMYRTPGEHLDLGPVLLHGRDQLGPGRYETLLCPGTLDGLPVLTFTAPWRLPDITPVPPSAAYLRHLATGLCATGAWDLPTIAGYLAHCPGAAGHWPAGRIAALAEEPRTEHDG